MYSTPNPNEIEPDFGDPSPEVIEAVRAADRADAFSGHLQPQDAEPQRNQLPRFPQVELYASGGGVRLRFKKD